MPTSEESFNYLEPEDFPFWTLPISRRYYNKVADVLIPDIPRLRLSMLCLPSFEMEWVIGIRVKGVIQPEYFLQLREAKEQIWMNEKPPAEIEVQTHEISVEEDFVLALSDVWKLMILKTMRTSRIRLDGIRYHFMLWDAGTFTGKTWSPQENSNPGRLVAIGESLREYARAEESHRPLACQNVEQQVKKLKQLLKPF